MHSVSPAGPAPSVPPAVVPRLTLARTALLTVVLGFVGWMTACHVPVLTSLGVAAGSLSLVTTVTPAAAGLRRLAGVLRALGA
ncbi:hypothetical protein [Amycolatopsis samaneae]|uniref:Uncharacterized protein n=1 Tax=Amycolatopsis samaneae TaxID=664691 RepID=A0ABW5GSV4_9PSEU